MKAQKYFCITVTDWATLFNLLIEYITCYLGLDISKFGKKHKLDPSTINKCKTTARQVDKNDPDSRQTVKMKTLGTMLKALDGHVSLTAPSGDTWLLDCSQPVGMELLQLVYPSRFSGKKPILAVADDTSPYQTLTIGTTSIADTVAIPRQTWNKQCQRGELPSPKEKVTSLHQLFKIIQNLNVSVQLELPMIEHHEIILPPDSLPNDTSLPVLKGVYNSEDQRHLILDHAVYHIPVSTKRGHTLQAIDGRYALLFLRPTATFLNDRQSSSSKHFKQLMHFPCGLYLIDAHPTEMTPSKMETDYQYLSIKKKASSSPNYLVFKLLAQLPLPFPTSLQSLAESRSGYYSPSSTTLGQLLRWLKKRK